jgi:hypothetical protein
MLQEQHDLELVRRHKLDFAKYDSIRTKMLKRKINSMYRCDVVAVLENWGTACYSDETLKELRECLLELCKAENLDPFFPRKPR